MDVRSSRRLRLFYWLGGAIVLVAINLFVTVLYLRIAGVSSIVVGSVTMTDDRGDSGHLLRVFGEGGKLLVQPFSGASTRFVLRVDQASQRIWLEPEMPNP